MCTLLLQQNHTKKQTDRHGQEEIQHGPQKGAQTVTLSLLNAAFYPSVMEAVVSYVCCFLFKPGDPVSFGERSSPEHPGGHRTVPLQRRGPQQNSHRGLLRGTVSFLTSLSVFPFRFFCLPDPLSNPGCTRSDEGIKPQEIGSLVFLREQSCDGRRCQ